MTLMEKGWILRLRECKLNGKVLRYILIIFLLLVLIINSIVLMSLQVQSKNMIAKSNQDETLVNLTEKIDRLISALNLPPNTPNSTSTRPPTIPTTTVSHFTSLQTEISTLPSEVGTIITILTTNDDLNPTGSSNSTTEFVSVPQGTTPEENISSSNIPSTTTNYLTTTQFSKSTSTQITQETFPVSPDTTISSVTAEALTDTTSLENETILTSVSPSTDTNSDTITTKIPSETTYTSPTSTTFSPETSEELISTEIIVTNAFSTATEYSTTLTTDSSFDETTPHTTVTTTGTTLRTTSTTTGTTLRTTSTTTGTTIRTTSITTGTTLSTSSATTDTTTTTMISTASTPITSSTPGNPKKQPYKMLRDLHNPKTISIKCAYYCRRPSIIKSNMTVTVDTNGNTKFFEAYLLGSQSSLALEKASYFALEELYPSSLVDVHTPADLSQEIPHCTTTPIDSNIKNCK